MTNVMGEIKPCHNPSQKPAIFPSRSGVFSISLGPAAQLANNNKQRHPIKIQTVVLMFTFPLLDLIRIKNISAHRTLSSEKGSFPGADC